MSPPVIAMLFREAQSGGITVNGHFFPEGTDLAVEPYALHHREDIYPDSWRYYPERWLADESTGVSAESVAQAQSAFCAFSVGPRSCIGKNFAYTELLIVLARLCFLYDMRLLPGDHLGEGHASLGFGRHRSGEFQLRDKFVGKPMGPMVQVRPRQANTGHA